MYNIISNIIQGISSNLKNQNSSVISSNSIIPNYWSINASHRKYTKKIECYQGLLLYLFQKNFFLVQKLLIYRKLSSRFSKRLSEEFPRLFRTRSIGIIYLYFICSQYFFLFYPVPFYSSIFQCWKNFS